MLRDPLRWWERERLHGGGPRGCGRWQWGPGWLGGPGCGTGDPFVAGRLRRAPRMEHCSVTWACGDGAGAAAATCPGPEQGCGRGTAGLGVLGAFLTQNLRLPHCSRAKCLCKGGQKSSSFPVSHFLQQIFDLEHCSLHMPQIPSQPRKTWSGQGNSQNFTSWARMKLKPCSSSPAQPLSCLRVEQAAAPAWQLHSLPPPTAPLCLSLSHLPEHP